MQPEAVCHSDRIGQRSSLHFPHDVAAMDIHGDLAQSHLGGDLLFNGPGYPDWRIVPSDVANRNVEA